MMRLHTLCTTLAVAGLCLTGPAMAQDIPAPFVDLLTKRAADCNHFEFGTMTVEDGALQQIDLNGDGALDHVLDEHHLRCSTAASLYCGTGGCSVSFLVNEALDTRLTKGWQVTAFSPMTVVLLQKHGSDCGGTNVNPCVEALVWDGELNAFNSVAPPIAQEN